ncbi:hypothetical protein GCM10009817_20790 [Terrabacter lapilli]|uniref:Uncharacterized protein n=1 Tax=Terrabacter lapilli TaxID=436231 RepID=A0ABP5DGW4_9MICO
MAALVYPRLGDAESLIRLATLREANTNPLGLRAMVGLEHDRAAPVPTGGSVAGVAKLRHLRERVADDVFPLLDEQGRVRGGFQDFDWLLGRSLHNELDIVRSDAAHRSTWNFLSLMVFPDLVWARFPDPKDERALGGARNVLRRAWHRYDVLADLDGHGAEKLNEDELVQLTERTSLARNRRLVIALARRIINHAGPRRMEFARELAKRATFVTGPLLLDVLSDHDLDELVGALGDGHKWSPAS